MDWLDLLAVQGTLRSLLQHHSSKALIQHSAFFTVQIHFQGKPFNITVFQAYAPTSNAEEAEQFYEDLQDLLTPKKDILFIIGDWNAKVGSQEIPGATANLAL